MYTIRAMEATDYPFVSTIYQQGIDTKNATFEQFPPAKWEDFSDKFLPFSKSVAIIENEIAGWAALSSVSSRCVYAGVCEVSVYVATTHRGKHIGTALLKHLIDLVEKNNIWTMQAGIFPENTASLKIHSDLGFRVVGHREKIGKMDGVWRDTLLLERRSKSLVHD